jgi:predicted Zn-dependent peptidase
MPPLPAPARAGGPASAAKTITLYKCGGGVTSIGIGARTAPAGGPDLQALGVLNTILGGIISSRLNRDLREEHGYSYGMWSWLETHRSAGALVGGGWVQSIYGAEATKAVLDEIARLRTQPVGAADLALAKEHLNQSLAARFDTAEGAADLLAEMATEERSPLAYVTRLAAVESVTAADVQQAARRYLAPDAVRIVVVGDAQRSRLAYAAMGTVDERDCN